MRELRMSRAEKEEVIGKGTGKPGIEKVVSE